MAKFDDASWHYGGDYPKDLPNENAATHIGMFVAWCIENDLVSRELQDDCKDEILSLKNRSLTGAEFLINCLDEKLCDHDLNTKGKQFAKAYYEDDTKFAIQYASFGNDYIDCFDEKAEQEGSEYETIYHIENTWQNYDLIKPIISQRFEEWQVFKEKLTKIV